METVSKYLELKVESNTPFNIEEGGEEKTEIELTSNIPLPQSERTELQNEVSSPLRLTAHYAIAFSQFIKQCTKTEQKK